jgi:hypothetical protein
MQVPDRQRPVVPASETQESPSMGSDWHTPATQIAKETHGLAPEQMSPGIPRGTHVPLTTSQKLRGLSQVAPPELQAWPSGTKAMQVRGAESGTQASPGKQSPID